MSEAFEPLIGYDFKADGTYDRKHYLQTNEEFRAFMAKHAAPAYLAGREAMLTDMGDNAVFHVKGGEILHAGGASLDQVRIALLRLARETERRSTPRRQSTVTQTVTAPTQGYGY